MTMRKSFLSLTLLALAAGTAATALAQGMPTTQPKFLHIFREEIKAGRSGDHAKWEAGWPAAFEKVKSPFNYIALQSITGPTEVWYVSPLANQAAYEEMLAAEQKDPALAAELERLAKGDAEFLSEQSGDPGRRGAGAEPRRLPGRRKDALLRDHDLPDQAGAPGRVDGRHQGLQGRRRPLGPERELAHLRRRGRSPRRHVPDLLFGRGLRRVRQDDGRGRSDLEGHDGRGDGTCSASS